MDKKILIQDLVDGLAARKSMSKKDAESFVKGTFDVIEEYLLSEGLVKVKGLGTFKMVNVDSRESINVNTGERFVIEGHSKINFTPDKSLADHVNRPFADFETVVINDETKTEDMERVDTPEVASDEENSAEDEPIVVGTPPSVVEEPEKQEVNAPAVTAESKKEPPKNEDSKKEELKKDEPKDKAVTEEPEKPAVKEEAEKTEPKAPYAEPEKKGSMSKWLIWLLLLAIVACAIFYVTKRQPTETVPTETTTVEETDTLATIEAQKADLETLVSENPQIEGGEYWIVGTKTVVTLERGDDLSKLALQYYGDKKLINYIILFNGYTHSQASNLFVGTEVKIPELVVKE